MNSSVALNNLFGENVFTGAVTQKKEVEENFYPSPSTFFFDSNLSCSSFQNSIELVSFRLTYVFAIDWHAVA